MDSTEGLVRGTKAADTGAPITVPVGPETLGRILNVIGEPVDEGEVVKQTHISQFTVRHLTMLISQQNQKFLPVLR